MRQGLLLLSLLSQALSSLQPWIAAGTQNVLNIVLNENFAYFSLREIVEENYFTKYQLNRKR